ncbi:MAG: hypothetical protein WCK32_05250 [Chlorobiaceae bacterium]
MKKNRKTPRKASNSNEAFLFYVNRKKVGINIPKNFQATKRLKQKENNPDGIRFLTG